MQDPNSTNPKPFVFVLMPFDEKFSDIYEFGIKLSCEEACAYCERVDEQYFEGTILNRIYNQIAKSDLIIADMTGKNPNVFYEVGYAHALNKKVILITEDSEDIPFDLKHYPHIIYKGSIGELKKELISKIEWFINNPSKNLPLVTESYEFYIDRKKLKSNVVFESSEANSFMTSNFSWVKTIDIHNISNHYLKSDSFKIGFLIPEEFDDYLTSYYEIPDIKQDGLPTQRIKNPQGGSIHVIEKEFCLYPGSWEQLKVKFSHCSNSLKDGIHEWSIILRIFTSTGTKDLPLSVRHTVTTDEEIPF